MNLKSFDTRTITTVRRRIRKNADYLDANAGWLERTADACDKRSERREASRLRREATRARLEAQLYRGLAATLTKGQER